MADILSDLGYAVDSAYDGPAALELTRQTSFALALLDYKLPGMNGVELYSHIKQVRADTVGVLVTAFAAADTADEAAAEEIKHVVPKPVDFGYLISIIEQVVGKP